MSPVVGLLQPGRFPSNAGRWAPLLLLIAGADGATPLPQSLEFAAQLKAAGVPVESHVYEGAPHSFFDRTYEQWKEASDDAWRRMLDFVKRRS